MGAEFDSGFINDPELKLTDKEIEVKAEEVFQESAYQNGHGGYTGSLAEKTDGGVSIHRDIEFNGTEEAYRHVQNNLEDDKWDQPHAVPVKGLGWFVGGWCSS